MSIESEITRLYGVRNNILQAIANKGVDVPSGSKLADCPELIASITSGGGFNSDSIVNIVPINKIAVVDQNGYIGYDLTGCFQVVNINYYYNYAILDKSSDFSQSGLGQVTFYHATNNVIGGREYRTVLLGGKEWMAENLDFKFSGLQLNPYSLTNDMPRAAYYNKDEATYGANGKNFGLLYNTYAAKYLNDNRATLIPGWHVPNNSEWNSLISFVGGKTVAGLKLKSTTGWTNNGDGSTEFNVVPTGYAYNDGATMSGQCKFSSINDKCYFYLEMNPDSASKRSIEFASGDSLAERSYNGIYGYPVRLVKDVQ